MDGSGFPVPKVSRDIPGSMADRLIVALDVPTPEEARNIVDRLDGVVSFFKIGLWLLFAEGTDRLIDDLIRQGKDVFLDYKMYDIGETVRQGVTRARERGVRFVTVHGDDDIMKCAVEGKGDSPSLKIFSITVLTSLDDNDLKDMGYRLTVNELIQLRVRKSLEWGCDGIIASSFDDPNEIRSHFGAEHLMIATPGVRRSGSATHDHKRHTTPAQAIAAGADYIVMGRPIVQNQDPAAEALSVIAEMESGQVR